MTRTNLLGVCVVLAAGCASFDGRGLVPGASTGAQVEALMGKPDERVAKPDGSSVLYYTRNPVGRHTYAVTLGPEGVMRSIDQRLTPANMGKLRTGATTKSEVRALFGPPFPATIATQPLNQREVWEYKWLQVDDKRVLWVYFSPDGILREFNDTHDFGADEPSGSSMP